MSKTASETILNLTVFITTVTIVNIAIITLMYTNIPAISTPLITGVIEGGSTTFTIVARFDFACLITAIIGEDICIITLIGCQEDISSWWRDVVDGISDTITTDLNAF